MNNFLSPFRHFFTPKPKKKPELFLRSSFLQLSVPVDKNVYVMSDIHGQYEAFLHMLWKIRFHQDKDLLILNGDLIDCGPDSYALLEYAMHEPVVFTLYGNHELNLVNAYSSFSFQANPTFCGQIQESLGKEGLREYISWLASLPCCCKLTLGNNQFLIAHASPPSISPEDAPDWTRCVIGGEQPFYQEAYKWGTTTLITGHTPVIWFSDIPDIWKSPDCTRYDIDCGAAYPEYGGRLGCLRLNDLAEFYTEV